MIIDTHVHIWEIDPPRYPIGPTAPGWKSLPDEPGTAEELLAEMDAHGIDRAVLVQTSWSTWDNGYIADSAARYPHRFIGHGLIDPQDPHNADPRYARVRVRETVLPVLEAELGPGIAEALARTAAQLREDAEAFDEMIDETIEDIVEHAEAGISVSAAALAANPAALRHRIIRHVVASEFHESLTRAQTLEVARLVTDWSGQGPIDLPGCRARRVGGRIEFRAR